MSENIRNFFPAYRVFIFGVEVTDDVMSVTVTHSDDRAPSTAEVVLANKAIDTGRDDRYVVTKYDIKAMTNFDPATTNLPEVLPVLRSLSEAASSLGANLGVLTNVPGFTDAAIAQAQSINPSLQEAILATTQNTAADIQRQILANIAADVPDPVKQRVLRTKANVTTLVGVPDTKIGGNALIATVQQFNALRGLAQRYPLQVGDCIFHSQDPVRIFFRDPRDPNAWYHMFAGFVSDTVDDVDANNTKTVTIRCEDVLRALRYARFTTSPGLIDIQAAATHVDLCLQTLSDDDFRSLSLPDFLFSLVFGFMSSGTDRQLQAVGRDLKSITGTTTVQLISPQGTANAYMNKDAVGLYSLDRSFVAVYGPQQPNDTVVSQSSVIQARTVRLPDQGLPLYQTIVDHRVQVTDLKSMAYVGAVPEEVTTIDTLTGLPQIDGANGVITAIGTHPEKYPVDGGRLIMLVPSTLGVGYTRGILYQGFKGPELKTTFSTRLQKIYDVLERVEFSFYANGRGDLIAEMPLYAFTPNDFGADVVTSTQIQTTFKTVGDVSTLLDPNHPAGPFAPHYRIAEQDTIKWSRTFNDERVRTLATCTWHVLPFKDGALADAVGQRIARRLLDALVPQFGVRHDPAEPTILVNDEAAAETYCQLLLNRINGDARQVTCEALPQLRIMPNRPILFTDRAFIGTVREVTHRLEWGEKGDMSMTFKTNYIRAWDGLYENDKTTPAYTFLGGIRANFLDYAILFKLSRPASMTQPQAKPTKGT